MLFFAFICFVCAVAFLYHFVRSFFERKKTEEEILARDKKIYASYWGIFLALGVSGGLRDNTIGFFHDLFISIDLGLFGFTLLCLFQMLVFKKKLKKAAIISFILFILIFIMIDNVYYD
ncbi:MAG: hypothetical protein J6O04_03025 [Selenomonadaceae bacterium]|nr:hypothetical protein [Selenomonadaceae bacterium]